MVNKRLINTGVSAPAPAGIDPLQNFETVTYTGNGSTQKITGYIRKGAAFNGSSSRVYTGSTFMNLQEFTVAGWFYFNSVSSTVTLAGAYEKTPQTTGDGGWLFRWHSTLGLNFGHLIGSTWGNSSVAWTPTAGQWYHLALSRNSTGSEIKFYVNGSQQGTTQSRTGTIVYVQNGGTATFTIGSALYNNSVQQVLDGKIDQVRTFNTAINSTQVGQLALEEYGDAENSVTDFFGNGTGVALYQLDEDANDTGGAGQSGYIGDAAKFNGSSSQITLNSLPIGAGDFTISLWIKPTAITNANYHMTFAQDGYSSGTGIAMYTLGTSTTTANFTPYFSVGGSAYNIISSSGISVNQWTHLALVRDYGSNWKAYMNGTLLTTYTSAGLTTDFTNSISYLGRHSNGLYRFNGFIDDVRIYSSALDGTNIGYIANNDTVNIPTSNLSVHYQLETDATDSAGSYDGVETDITYGFTGTATNVNFLGMAFQPDLVVIKNRETVGYEFTWFDSIRGALQRLRSDSVSGANAEDTKAGSLTSFDTNGFSLGNYAGTNQDTKGHVAWCWKAGGASTTISGGDISADVSANTEAGFSIVKYTGNGNTTYDSVPHGLNSAPELIINKGIDTLTQGTNYWVVSLPLLGAGKYAFLNTTDGVSTSSNYFGTLPDSTYFYVGGAAQVGNEINKNFISYCFHSVDGYQRVGTYEGNGNVKTIYTDSNGDGTGTGAFQPRWVMIKNVDDLGNWMIYDAIRDTDGTIGKFLVANTSDFEVDASSAYIVPNSTGFTTGNSNSVHLNKLNQTFIYLAIA